MSKHIILFCIAFLLTTAPVSGATTGTVLRITDNKVIIDLGSKHGVSLGDKLLIYKTVDTIKFLIATLEIKVVYPERSGGIIIFREQNFQVEAGDDIRKSEIPRLIDLTDFTDWQAKMDQLHGRTPPPAQESIPDTPTETILEMKRHAWNPDGYLGTIVPDARGVYGRSNGTHSGGYSLSVLYPTHAHLTTKMLYTYSRAQGTDTHIAGVGTHFFTHTLTENYALNPDGRLASYIFDVWAGFYREGQHNGGAGGASFIIPYTVHTSFGLAYQILHNTCANIHTIAGQLSFFPRSVSFRDFQQNPDGGIGSINFKLRSGYRLNDAPQEDNGFIAYIDAIIPVSQLLTFSMQYQFEQLSSSNNHQISAGLKFYTF